MSPLLRPAPRLVAPVVALVALTGGLVACTRGSASSATPTPAASTSASPSAGHAHAAPGGAAATAGTAATDDEGPAAGVRLQALIGQHTVLAADMMRARIRQDPDFAQAAEAALTRNTQALSTLVGSLFGPAAASSFSDLWAGHVTELFEYAEARRTGDAAGQKRARERLVEAELGLSSFFADASKGRLARSAATDAVRTHVDQLLAQADAYAAREYVVAANSYRHGYEHGYGLGGALARALLPAADAAALDTPGWQLRANLTQLLGEHVALVVAATRAASGPATGDFKALGDTLNANTQGLAGAVGTLFGAPAATRFQELWADHVDALMTVTAAAARGDRATQQQAERRLRSFEPTLAAFLDTATQSRIGADALAHAYVMHDRMLVGQVQAHQAKDYTKAHDLGYRAYSEMFDLAAQLSNAIELTLGSKLPRGGSQTGGGGTAAGGP